MLALYRSGRQAVLGGHHDPSTTAVPIVLVAGMAGVGKTALAVHWAHQVAGRFPGGQLYLDLRGFSATTPVRPIEALRQLLHGLGVDQVPADLEEAQALVSEVIGVKRVEDEAEATADLARACAHLPLALRIAAANLADDPHQPVAGQVAALRAGDRLAAAHLVGIDLEGLNGVLWARLPERALDDAIERALAPFQEAGAPMLWHVGPASSPRALPRALEAGLAHHESEPGMIADLGALGAALTHACPVEARGRGLARAVLTASPEGHGIYRRLGFRDCCTASRYRYPPAGFSQTDT